MRKPACSRGPVASHAARRAHGRRDFSMRRVRPSAGRTAVAALLTPVPAGVAAGLQHRSPDSGQPHMRLSPRLGCMAGSQCDTSPLVARHDVRARNARAPPTSDAPRGMPHVATGGCALFILPRMTPLSEHRGGATDTGPCWVVKRVRVISDRRSSHPTQVLAQGLRQNLMNKACTTADFRALRARGFIDPATALRPDAPPWRQR